MPAVHLPLQLVGIVDHVLGDVRATAAAVLELGAVVVVAEQVLLLLAGASGAHGDDQAGPRAAVQRR
jgi:hypothetical protein